MTAHPESTMSQPFSGLASPRPMRSRTQSFSSDRPSAYSANSSILMFPPLQVSPEAAFIAESAASQIVTNDHDVHADSWFNQYGIETSSEPALITPAALILINTFLDQLLFNFLHHARGTSLSILRPAVTEVLKPKLAKDAIKLADEELREYLGGSDDIDEGDVTRAQSDWDQELVWKRTRLRCMVYSSLGDLEEEDEDFFLDQDGLDVSDEADEVISPAVAIFLTSILEFMGEQALVIAGQAAYQRARIKFEKDVKEGIKEQADTTDRIVIEDADMERVALDRTLGRLWRGWKKRIRTPQIDSSRDSFIGRHIRRVSNYAAPEPSTPRESILTPEVPDVAKEPKIVEPENIPLPMTENDVDEIEVPGLVVYSDDEKSNKAVADGARPKSFMMLPSSKRLSYFTPVLFDDDFEVEPRKRSNSLPASTTSAAVTSLVQNNSLDSVEFVGQDSSMLQPHVAKDTKYLVRPSKEDAISASEPKVHKAATEASKTGSSSPGTQNKESVFQSPNSKNRENKRKSRALQTPLAIQTGIPLPSGTRAEHKDTATDDELDELDEEPEILTSARISISTGSASPNITDTTQGFVPGHSRRNNSVHSARIIDVSGPKSPVGSRASSIDTLERVRTSSASRTSSVSASPILEEQEPSDAFKIQQQIPPRHPDRNAARAGPSKANSPVVDQFVHPRDNIRRTELIIPAHNTDYAQSPTLPREDLQKYSQQQAAVAAAAVRHSPRLAQEMNFTEAHGETTHPTRSSSMQNAMNQVVITEQYRPSMRSSQPSIQTIHEDPSPTQVGFPMSDVDTESMRPIHTWGSNGSGGNKLKITRTSEEDDKVRDFEELIQSDQTIQFTLTPENMRNIEDSPRSGSPAFTRTPRHANTAGESSHSRSSSSTTEARRKPSVVSMFDYVPPNPLHSHPVPQISSALKSQSSVPSSKLRGTTTARDARVNCDSTLDFAQFIRSTGPIGGDNPPIKPTVLSRSSSMQTTRSASAHHTTGSVDATNRRRLVAREPALKDRDNNADLIEFIRQGPPGPTSSVRSPTALAAVFSAAMARNKLTDSESDIRHSQGSARGTDISINGSVTSQTALLKQSASTGFANNGTFDDEAPIPKRKTRRVRDPYAIDFSDEEDLFNDDDLDLGAAHASLAKPAAKEESLADFLRNYNPPDEQQARPLAINTPHPTPEMPKKKSSMPSLIGRLTRGSLNRDRETVPNVPAVPNAYTNGITRSGSVTTSNSGRSRGYIPIQVSMPAGYDKYGSVDSGTSSLAPSHQSRPSMGSSQSYKSLGISMGAPNPLAVSNDNRPSVASGLSAISGPDMALDGAPPRSVPMQKFVPKEASVTHRKTGTSDLAEFLRSDPPPGMMAGQGVSAQQEVASGQGHRRMFSRRKKPAVV